MPSGTLRTPAVPSPAPPPADGHPPAGAPPRIVARRPLGQWAAAAVVLVLLGLVLRSVAGNDAFRWDLVAAYFLTTPVLNGLLLTLGLTAAVMVLGFALGTVLATMRLSANPVLRGVSSGYVWLFRSMPVLVQLLFWFNIGALYPTILGIRTVHLLAPPAIAVLGLTLHEAAYAAEVVRAGILSVDRGQTEAAQALGLGRWRRLRRIVLPQAMRSIVPPAGNMLIGTLKGTSVVSMIAVNDLLYSVQLIYHRTYQVIPMLMVATVWYVIITSLLSVGQHYVERRYARGTAGAR
ncbi:amino acid ABC transporter permease [Streptomyces sp. NPDC014733]|uniref:amino acid ABC transporter permease n=1 Tax=Streptomyces sp. NPDC014733 TaxID=3364885 RepID=UPI0036F8B212